MGGGPEQNPDSRKTAVCVRVCVCVCVHTRAGESVAIVPVVTATRKAAVGVGTVSPLIAHARHVQTLVDVCT